jgi:hypothetical protein
MALPLIARDIVNKAAKKIRLYPSDQPLEGEKFKAGMSILNDVLDVISASPVLLPFTKLLEFPLLADKTAYSIGQENSCDVVNPKPVSINDVFITIGNVKYPIEIVSQHDNYSLTRCSLTQTLYNYVFVRPEDDRTILEFVFKPWSLGTCTINAKFEIPNVSLPSDEIGLPQKYRFFLEYSVARELASEYGGWSQEKEGLYKGYLSDIQNSSYIDIQPRKHLFVSNNNIVNYGWVW